jgi:hypothetical protein
MTFVQGLVESTFNFAKQILTKDFCTQCSTYKQQTQTTNSHKQQKHTQKKLKTHKTQTQESQKAQKN